MMWGAFGHVARRVPVRLDNIFVIAALLLAACGGSDAPPADSEPPPPPFDWSMRVGTATLMQDTLCMTVPAPTVAGGTPVLLVSPSEPQTFARATIVAPMSGCAGSIGESGMAHYRLTSDDPVEISRIYVAIVDSDRAARLSADTVLMDVDGDGYEDRFRECTSMEGLHLTIWTGAPILGDRKWHTYYYLGYDVEPTCTAAETGEITPATSAASNRP